MFSKMMGGTRFLSKWSANGQAILVLACFLSGLPFAMAQNPVPLVSQPLVPAAVSPGSTAFTLTVHGVGFVPGATMIWNGLPLTTAFVSSSQLTALVPAANVATAGTASVSVVNPGTAASNVVYFPVVVPASTVVYSNASGSPIDMGTTGGFENEPMSIAAGDFNGDGKLDFAVGVQMSSAPGDIRILLGNGDGTFADGAVIPAVGVCPCSIAVGDLDGDRNLDLAVGNFRDNTVAVLIGAGDGTFVSASGSPLSVGVGPTAVALGDFNSDGKVDLAVTNSFDNNLTILLGNGDGTFVPASSQPATGAGPFGLAAGDFNGDGKLDLAVANFDVSTVTVLLGNGDGTFAAAPSPVATVGSNVVTADFNGDGKLDLAVTNRANSTVSVLLGNGDGTFTPVNGCCGTPVELTHTFSMAAGDFNGDGRVDLAISVQNIEAPFPEDYVVMLLGNADGTFTSTDFSLLLPDGAFSMTAGDFNGDGKLDFATASNPYNFVSVLLQNDGAGPAPDFSITPQSTSATVVAGGTAEYRVDVSSLNGFLGEVSLSCTGAPSHARCTLPASGFLFDTVTGTFTVTVSTTANRGAVRSAAPMSPGNGGMLGLWTALLGAPFAAILIPTQRKSVRANALRMLLLTAALAGVVLLPGCGGGSTSPPPPPSGTPPGTYTLMVTATSGSRQHSTTLTLIVQ